MIETTIADSLDRKNVVFEDGTQGRVYYNTEMCAPSVTTVTDRRIDPEKEAALEGWRDRYDGSSKWKSPHWEDQMAYKGYRGTLAHYTCFDGLGDLRADDYYSQCGEDTKGYEEYYAEYKLKTWGEYDGEDAWDSAVREIYWVYQKFEELCAKKGITPASVVGVEQYILDTLYQYAGQVDLIYENEDGEIVVADLKTSSGIREDYRLQVAAYAKALPIDVDRVEIIRIYPDRKEIEIESDEEWDRSIDSYFEQFLGLLYKTHLQCSP